MKYIDADRIRAEIERRKGYISVTHFAEDLLSFLDTLEEPSCPKELNDLKKEVQHYYSDNFDYITSDQPTLSILTNIARHFAEWQKEQYTREMIMSDGSYFQKCYELGKKDMKEQMMEGAVDYKIVNNLAAYPVIYYEVKHLGLKYGDKVKIIVCKKEDEQ